MNIAVGTLNPVKIEAVETAIQKQWPTYTIQGYTVNSDVSAQPMSDEETKQGSINRAKYALAALLEEKGEKIKEKDSIVGIGLEGGVFLDSDKQMWNTVWVSVVDSQGRLISVNGSRFLIPKIIADGILNGEEMGVVADRVAGIDNIKHKAGFIGYITHNLVTRAEAYSSLAKLAIGIWWGNTKNE